MSDDTASACSEIQLRLGQADSAGGASISASTAFRALVGVNAIDIAFRDSANGAFVDTGAASYAVFANNVSHNSIVRFKDLTNE